jgi:hypothetical protein
VGGLSGVGLEFAAQLDNVGVDHAIGDEDVSSPDGVDDLSAGDDPPRTVQEELEHLELNGREVGSRSGRAQLGAREIGLAIAEAADGLGFGDGAAEQRADAGAELAGAERFGDVVVGAEVESHHLLGLLRFGGEHQDRRADLVAAQVAADIETVAATGSDLKKRIEAIMTNRTGVRVSRAKQLLLAMAGVTALAAPVAIGVATGVGAPLMLALPLPPVARELPAARAPITAGRLMAFCSISTR